MVYVTGDLHGDARRLKDAAWKPLRRGDTMIVCGDFGFIWNGDKAEQKLLKKLGNLPFNLAFLDGIHENHQQLASYPVSEWNGGKVHAITGRLYHLMRGQVYNIDGRRLFVMGGGENPDADCHDARMDACMPTLDDLHEANRCLSAYDYRVDYVLTHDCSGAVRNFLHMDESTINHLYAFLDNAAQVIDYRKWFFGCQHIDKLIPPKYVGVFQAVHRLD